MTRRRISPTERARIFAAAGGRCHLCGGAIDGVRDRWDVEHVVPLALGGDDGGDNLQPAHAKCHAAKTPVDVAQIAKAKRVQRKHQGAHRSGQRLPGSRGGKWKRKLDGTTVLRGENA
jgi:5-methylcytosine-specific restriction endonuclease McrA